MSFAVDTAALRTVAADLHAMAAAIPQALAYADSHVSAPRGGHVVGYIVDELDRARSDLQAAYAGDGPLQSYFQGAGDALRANADDYDATDLAQRAEFDALLDDPAAPADPTYGLDADGETAGVTTGDLTTILTPPGDFFEGLDVWRSILDNTSYVVSCLWVFDALAQMPFFYELPRPSQDLRDTFDGDWTHIGTAALALDQLKDFFARAEAETSASVLGVQASWSGNAADSAYASFGGFVEVLAGHQTDLGTTSQGFNGFAMGMRFLTDALCGALDTLVGIVIELCTFDLNDIVSWFKRGGSQALRWINVISKAIDLIILCIDLVFALVAVFPLTLGQINRYNGLAVPTGATTTFTPSDVNGP